MSGQPGPVAVGAGGVRLATVLHGPSDAPVVVVQHGVGSSRRYLAEAVVPPLLGQGWQVAVAPVRGHDGADPVDDPADHTLDLLAADLGALVAVTDAVACGGVSIGAHAAVAAVARGHAPPGTAVVAALPAWTGTRTIGEGAQAAVAAEVRAVGVAGMHTRLATTPGLRRWLRAVLLRDLTIHHRPSLVAALLALDGGEAPSDADLAALPPGCGVVGWHGDPGHPLVTARRWASAAPAARFERLDLADPDRDPLALGRAVARALGRP